ncbi:MAG TPA: hypothetical protein VFF05_04390, partial [Rudaea sp.]|nr:hypothetical protein [Rudaea sp.]
GNCIVTGTLLEPLVAPATVRLVVPARAHDATQNPSAPNNHANHLRAQTLAVLRNDMSGFPWYLP